MERWYALRETHRAGGSVWTGAALPSDTFCQRRELRRPETNFFEEKKQVL